MDRKWWQFTTHRSQSNKSQNTYRVRLVLGTLLLYAVSCTGRLLFGAPVNASVQERLTWDDPNPTSRVAGYFLYYWQRDQADATKVDIGLMNPFPLRLLSLQAKRTYHFAITVYEPDHQNESTFSNEVTVACLVAPPDQECPADGDVNQDGRLTPEDARLALQHFLQALVPILDTCQQQRANVVDPAASTITPADVVCIWERFLGRTSCPEPSLPLSCQELRSPQ